MYHIIINPASRSGKGLTLWKEEVEPALKKENVEYTPYFSEKAGDVARIGKQILTSDAHRPIHIIILGGDGTVNEFLQDVEDTSQVILGYIPTGSSNDLARDLKIPKKLDKALELILHTGTPKPMDIGSVVSKEGISRRFVVSCGIGFDAAVCEETGRSKLKAAMNKSGLGKLSYLGIALKQLFAAKKISGRLYIDRNAPVEIENMLFTVGMLHRYEGGGFMFAPDALSNDGLLNFCAVGDVSKLLILFALPTAFFGKHYMFNGITPYTSKKVTIETNAPMWFHTDGEILGKSTSITITCKANAIQMLY